MQLSKGKLRDAETGSLRSLLERQTEATTESVHLRYDDGLRTIAVYRQLGTADDQRWFRADVSDVDLTTRMSGRVPGGFFLTHDEAETVLTWLDRMRVERNVERIDVTYYETNNTKIIERAGLDNETVVFEYETSGGRSNTVHLHGVYTNDHHMMANF